MVTVVEIVGVKGVIDDSKKGRMSWMGVNLKFSQAQASRYMRAFDRKDSLKLLSESNFGGWERALIEHKPKPKQEVEEDERIDCH